MNKYNYSEQPYDKLIPSLTKWPAETTWYSWLACEASFEHAIAYSQIFWPQFIEHCGGIFLAYNFNREVFDQWSSRIKDIREIEKLLNHSHIFDIFGNPGIIANEEQIDYIAHLLCDTWRCKLNNDFPEKTFEVIYSRGSENMIFDSLVTFYQKTIDA